MKRVRIAPGKFVTISPELAERAAHVFATGLTRDQVDELRASEPRLAAGLLIGSRKPLALARPRTVVVKDAGKGSPTPTPSCHADPADALQMTEGAGGETPSDSKATKQQLSSMNRRPNPYVTAEKTRSLWMKGADELAARLSAGDMVSMDEAADVAGVRRRTLESWAAKGRVVAVRNASGAYRLPIWQFDPVLWPCISELNGGLGSRDGWALLSFLETPQGALNGRTPRQAIEQGQAERVVALAREHL